MWLLKAALWLSLALLAVALAIAYVGGRRSGVALYPLYAALPVLAPAALLCQVLIRYWTEPRPFSFKQFFTWWLASFAAYKVFGIGAIAAAFPDWIGVVLGLSSVTNPRTFYASATVVLLSAISMLAIYRLWGRGHREIWLLLISELIQAISLLALTWDLQFLQLRAFILAPLAFCAITWVWHRKLFEQGQKG